MAKTLKEKTVQGLLWSAVSNLLTQVLNVLIGIFLARLLTPADYGLVGMLAIFTAIAGSLQESGFIAALTNLKVISHRDYNAVFWFSTTVSLTLYTLLFFSAPLIARFFHHPELVDLSRLVFAGFVAGGIGIAHSAYMFRNMMNKEKAVINLFALAGSGTVGITLALNGYAYWSLAWQQLTYIVIYDLGRLYYVRWLPTLPVDMTPVKEMFGFSSKLLVTNIVNQVNNNVLSLIFGRLFPAKTVGNYTQAAKWNTMGYSLISSTIQQVAQPVLASINDQQERQLNAFRKMLRFTAFLSMPALFGLALVSEEFITLLLSEKWIDSVPLLQILCISGAFLPIHTLYQILLISRGRSNAYMWCTIAQIVTQISIILAFSAWGIEVMITAFSTMLVLWTFVWNAVAHHLLGLRFRDVFRDIAPFFFISIGCLAVTYYVTQPIEQPALLLTARVVLAGALYAGVMKVVRVAIFNECFEYLGKYLHKKK